MERRARPQADSSLVSPTLATSTHPILDPAASRGLCAVHIHPVNKDHADGVITAKQMLMTAL